MSLDNFQRFSQRKLAEINFLRSWLGEPHLADLPPDLLTEKVRLIRLIHANQLSQSSIMLTNIYRRQIEVLGAPYITDYTRQGSEFQVERAFTLFYPGLPESLTSAADGKGFFLKSGQTANYLVLAVLTALGDDLTFDIPERTIYFETDAILFYLKQQRYRPEARAKGLLIDSGVQSLQDITPAKIAQHDVVVFDTTCFFTNHPEFLRVMQLLLDSQKLVMLTRSHLKLDSLGVEYGALGSLFVLNPSAYRGHVPSEIGDPHCLLENFVRKMASIMGAHSQPHEIYPFLVNTEFLRLNEQRVKALNANMGRVEASIMRAIRHHGLKEMLSVESYQHQLYCKVRLRSPVGERLAAAFTKIKQACRIEAYHCDSFGFDFLGVCTFRNSEGKEFIRITSMDGTCSDQDLDSFFIMIFAIVAEVHA